MNSIAASLSFNLPVNLLKNCGWKSHALINKIDFILLPSIARSIYGDDSN